MLLFLYPGVETTAPGAAEPVFTSAAPESMSEKAAQRTAADLQAFDAKRNKLYPVVNYLSFPST